MNILSRMWTDNVLNTNNTDKGKYVGQTECVHEQKCDRFASPLITDHSALN